MGVREYIDDAIRTGKTVTIEYVKYQGERSVRTISDIHYSDEFGSGYIEAFCHKRQANRTFKINRIISVDGVTDHSSSASSMMKKTKTAYGGNSAAYGTTSSVYSSTDRPSLSLSSSTKSSSSFNTSCSSSTRTTSNSEKSEGCYIATMAYGDYDHPQVMVLRGYRDEVLLKTVHGRLFVKFYYWFSPKLVKILRGKDSINAFFRSILDRIVAQITKSNKLLVSGDRIVVSESCRRHHRRRNTLSGGVSGLKN